jgi:REP element-mobilizing transposase RayT
MVEAYHVVIPCYGFWLPNDERGSGSWYVGSKALYKFGRATHVDSQRSVAGRPYDRALRVEAKKNLKYAPVVFNGRQARAIARGIAKYVRKSGLIVYACAIMSDHIHLVVLRHRYSIEKVMIKLKAAATTQLIEEGLHPFQDIIEKDGQRPKVFARDGRHIFLNSEEDVRGRIKYVRENPIKIGLREQIWSFVVEYRGLRDE